MSPKRRTLPNRSTAMGILSLLLLGTAACSDNDDGPSGPVQGEIEIPTAYAFESRFEEGTGSVSYSGQTVRNLLIQDLKIFIDQLGVPGAEGPIVLDDLLKFYEYDDALNLECLTTVGGMPIKEASYSEIATGRNLVGKISPAPFLGATETADDKLRAWFDIIVENSRDKSKLGTPAVYTTDDGLDLSQMINKVLLGAVAYYQATSIYLNGITDRDNAGPRSEGSPSSAMEHSWDEAFGYYGAARNYSDYSDGQLAGAATDYARDVSGDQAIDFTAEYNFAFARNAGKRDRGGDGTDFTAEIFEAFRTGRTHIANEKSAADIQTQARRAAEGWERVIAATVVHYINETMADMRNLGTSEEDVVALNKHWAEMKGFTYALQYSPFKVISDTDLIQLHEAFGDAPEHDMDGGGVDSALLGLETAKGVIQSAYDFSSSNMEAW